MRRRRKMAKKLVDFKKLLSAHNNLDLICALVGSVLSIVLGVIFLANSEYLLVVIMFLSLIAFAIYIFLRGFKKITISFNDVAKLSHHLPILLDTAFFFLICICTVFYFTRPISIERPLSFFILSSLAVGVLAVKIYLLPDSKWQKFLTLAEIIVIGLGLKLSVLGLYPSIIGQDTWTHMNLAENFKDTWDINVNGGWIGMHIIAALGLMGGLSYRAVTMFLFVPIQVIGDTVFIYLIGKELFNIKIGMLASLLLMMAGWYVFFGYEVIPNTLAVTFVLVSIYMFIKAHKNRSWKYLIGAIVFVIIVSFTHPIPIIWLWALMGLFLCGMLIYRFLYFQKVEIPKMTMVACILTIAIPLFLWSRTGYLGTVIFQAGLVGSVISHIFSSTSSISLLTSSNVTIQSPPLAVNPSIAIPSTAASSLPMMQNMLDIAHLPEYLFNISGVLIFFALALIGVMYMISRKYGNLYSFALGIGGVCTAFLTFFPSQVIKELIFTDRGCYLGQVIMAIPLAIALVLIVRTIPRNIFRYMAMGLIVGSLCFLSIIGKPANTDARIISKNQIVRYGFSQQELDAARWAWEKTDASIGLDPQYTCALLFPDMSGGSLGMVRVKGIAPYLESGDFSKCDSDIVLIRNEVVNEPFGWGDGRIYRLTYDPNNVLLEQGWQKVFDNGEVCGYERQ